MSAYRTTTAESGDAIAAVYEAAPGTTVLYDAETEHGATAKRLHQLQHAKHGDSHILLVPQPSLVDPNDPLRWSTFKKWVVLLNGAFYSFMGAVTGPIMAAGMVQLSTTYDVPFAKITYANGATLICQGVATTVWLPFAVKYGRRPVYLLSTILMGVACIWCGLAATRTYPLLLAGRTFLGLFEAPIESIVPSTITDIFFLHERGEKVSVYGLAVLGGNEIGPMLSAFIIQYLGMNWAFFIVGFIIFGATIPIFFTMPETKFTGPRPSLLRPDSGPLPEKQPQTETRENSINSLERSSIEPIPKRGYMDNLKLWSKGDPDVNILHVFLRPFVLLAYPTVIWSCFVYGFALAWNVIIGSTVAQLYAPPPYLFDSQSQGLVFISPFVGSIVGTYFCGPLADRVANYYTKANHGIREPEMRLPTCIVAAVLTFLGALMFSLGLHFNAHWAVSVVGLGVLSAGGQMGATLAMSYSLDCHQELSVELMVTIAAVKSAIAWIWTWVINDWLVSDGPLIVFMTIAAVNMVVYLTTLIFHFKGKSVRIWLYRMDFMGKAGLN